MSVSAPPLFPELHADEKLLREQLEAGESVVVNLKRHPRLVAWAGAEGKLVRIDRRTAWGNPFRLRRESDRDQVIRDYAKYLERSPLLLVQIDDLRGKALACWCAPKPCHGDELLKRLCA